MSGKEKTSAIDGLRKMGGYYDPPDVHRVIRDLEAQIEKLGGEVDKKHALLVIVNEFLHGRDRHELMDRCSSCGEAESLVEDDKCPSCEAVGCMAPTRSDRERLFLDDGFIDDWGLRCLYAEFGDNGPDVCEVLKKRSDGIGSCADVNDTP